MTEWRRIPNYPDYEVSEDGDVRSQRRSINRPRILKKNFVGPNRDRPQVQLYSGLRVNDRPKYKYVAHIVADTFIGGRGNKRVHYYDENPQNVSANNLYF